MKRLFLFVLTTLSVCDRRYWIAVSDANVGLEDIVPFGWPVIRPQSSGKRQTEPPTNAVVCPADFLRQ